MTRTPLEYSPHRTELENLRIQPPKVVSSLMTYTLGPSIVLKYFHKGQMGLKGILGQFAIQLVSK